MENDKQTPTIEHPCGAKTSAWRERGLVSGLPRYREGEAEVKLDTRKSIPSGSIAIPDLKEVWCSYGGGHTFMSRARVRPGVKRCCDDPAHRAEQRAEWQRKAKKRMRKEGARETQE